MATCKCILIYTVFVIIIFIVICQSVCGLPVPLPVLSDEFYYQTTTGVKCLKCPPGFKFVDDCQPGFLNSTLCAPCPDGRFSPEWNIKWECKECTQCQGLDEINVTSCNTTHDYTCGCNPGYFHEDHLYPSVSKCIEYTLCGVGLGASPPVPLQKDLTCVKCKDGVNFSDGTSYIPCEKCRDCVAEGLNVLKQCTVISNAVCDTKSTQAPSLTTHSSPTSTSETSISVSISPGEGSKTEHEVIMVTIIGIVILAIIVVLLILFFCCWKEWRRGSNILHSWIAHWPRMSTQHSFTHSNSDGMASLDAEELTRNVYGCHNLGSSEECSDRTPLTQRRASSTAIGPGDDLNLHDVYMVLSQELGNSHKPFIKRLRGEELTPTEWAEPDYRRMGFQDAIVFLLETWRSKNPYKTNVEVLTLFCSTASEMRMTKICNALNQWKEKFASPSADSEG